MVRISMLSSMCFVTMFGLAVCGGDAKGEDELVGTWKIVAGRYGGVDVPRPANMTTIKHITPTHYMWATYDKDGNVTRAGGGPYTIKDGVMESTPEYGFGSDFQAIKGARQTYKCRIEGNKWYQSGTLSTGQSLEEVWERIEKK